MEISEADKIPGAVQKEEDPLSGGDLGSVQYRPDTAWEEYNYINNNFGFILNPLGLEAVTAIYLLLFKGQKWQVKNPGTGKMEDKYRIGFINGEGYEKTRELALKKVNQSPEYIRKVLEWSKKYEEAISVKRS